MDSCYRLRGDENLQSFEDCLLLLRILESMHRRTYGGSSIQVQNIRGLQSAALQNLLDYVTDIMRPPMQQQQDAPPVVTNRLSRTSSVPGQSGSMSRSNARSKTTPRSLSRFPSQVSSSSSVWTTPQAQSSSSLGFSPKAIYNSILARKSLEATQTELMDRARKLIVITTDFVMFSATISEVTNPAKVYLESLVQEDEIEVISSDRMFARSLLEFLIKAMAASLERTIFRNRGMSLSPDAVRLELGRLLCHFLSPQSALYCRLYALELIMNEARPGDIVKMLIKSDEGLGERLALHLYNLLTSHTGSLSRTHRDEVDELLSMLEQSGVRVYRLGSRLSEEQELAVTEDQSIAELNFKRQRARWLEKRDNARPRVLQKLSGLGKKVSGRAMESTQLVVKLQNQQRRDFLEHVKQQMSLRLNTKRAWYQLIQQLSHERSVMRCPYQPSHWQLDPTEGPGRVRKRLQRCHLNMEQRFFRRKDRHNKTQATLQEDVREREQEDLVETDAQEEEEKEVRGREQEGVSELQVSEEGQESGKEELVGKDAQEEQAEEVQENVQEELVEKEDHHQSKTAQKTVPEVDQEEEGVSEMQVLEEGQESEQEDLVEKEEDHQSKTAQKTLLEVDREEEQKSEMQEREQEDLVVKEEEEKQSKTAQETLREVERGQEGISEMQEGEQEDVVVKDTHEEQIKTLPEVDREEEGMSDMKENEQENLEEKDTQEEELFKRHEETVPDKDAEQEQQELQKEESAIESLDQLVEQESNNQRPQEQQYGQESSLPQPQPQPQPTQPESQIATEQGLVDSEASCLLTDPPPVSHEFKSTPTNSEEESRTKTSGEKSPVETSEQTSTSTSANATSVRPSTSTQEPKSPAASPSLDVSESNSGVPYAPLEYLFEAEDSGSDSVALIYKLHTSESILYTCNCVNVTLSAETKGSLLIGERDVYFVADSAILERDHTQVLLGNRDLLFLKLPQQDITELHKRWFQLRDRAVEVFLNSGRTCLLAFSSTRERNEFYKELMERELPSLERTENIASLQEQWLQGLITNYDYLAQINKLAGRSFNYLMQYPVFPFVLRDYQSPVLDLSKPAVYRNFSKPIGIQNPVCEERIQRHYESISQLLEHNTADHEVLIAPHHYGTHYSNAGSIMKYMVRVPPYTQDFISFQGNSFDQPERLFTRIQPWWGNEAQQADVKELIPELFFLPELFINFDGFELGTCQDGERVDDVRLPPWSSQNARTFVNIHRQALESDYTTRHLAAWIDLVFGAKQQGRAAYEAMNTFHPATYYALDVEKYDPHKREVIRQIIKNYGQTPKQLFQNPHPTPYPNTYRPKPRNEVQAVRSVRGLRWGQYVFSPDYPPPKKPIWRSKFSGTRVATIVPFNTGEVLGLGSRCHVAIQYTKPQSAARVGLGSGQGSEPNVAWLSVISWGYVDGVVRVQSRGSEPVNFVHTAAEVSCCATAPESRLLFFGYENGVITAQHTLYNSHKASKLQVFGKPVQLYGHTDTVTALIVSPGFRLVVSASKDNTVIIWDLNRLVYVRSIQDHKSAVRQLCVSETSGDIVSVSQSATGGIDSGSLLMLHDINAAKVAEVRVPEFVHCVCFSSGSEGRHINVIAGGLRTGTIRLWCSWNLMHVRDVVHPLCTANILSVSFSRDNQRLFVADAEGQVMCWQAEGAGQSREVNFIPHTDLNTLEKLHTSSVLSFI